MAKENQSKRELTLTRVFDTPRELVWKAWTDPKVVTKWWGPRGVTTPVCEVDARPGGGIHIVMLAGKELGSFAGQRWPMKGTFSELTPPERLAYVSSAMDDKQGVLLEARNTLTLEELGGRTRMTLRIAVTRISPGGEFALAGMEAGWNQSLDKLGEELAR
jgi:uncharacterized protein YndB with AHSA1/START domain